MVSNHGYGMIGDIVVGVVGAFVGAGSSPRSASGRRLFINLFMAFWSARWPCSGSSGCRRAGQGRRWPATLVGIVLIVLGALALAYQGITYTTREKVVDLGPIKASVDKQKTIPLPPILGAVALAAGVVLLVVGNRQG